MRPVIVAAGIIALAFSSPSIGKPGNGHGNGHLYDYGYAYGHLRHGRAYGHLRHRHYYGRLGPVGYGAGGCPPGLAKKDNGCMPPGQEKKLLRDGYIPHGLGL